ncbi:valine--tRNA ligase [Candidatus Beckwithbacteria bacterium]|nr:valine--tRNA ligase [Candidatus Beckwithbacteria bacterium]
MDISKNYDHQNESKIYQKWQDSGLFNPDNLPASYQEPYSIMMPPPNVTGVLHLGHALENALMDIKIRFARMKGKKALLIPGTDHAAVATQAKLEKILQDKGIKNPRLELGREKLLAEIRQFAEDSKSTILNQIKSLGTSCDWSRLAYTFDEQRNQAVNEIFVKMYNDGLIYQGFRTVNWSVKGQSTLSDDEVVYSEEKTTLYTFRYSQKFPILISTTRPETKLGDTAVVVHPDDQRYENWIGREFTVDVGAQNPLKIKIIADKSVDSEFGTGALGLTPAHSHIDYEIYQKNKEVGLIQVIGEDGKMTAKAGKAYKGLTVMEAREKFVKYLKRKGLMIKEKKIVHNIGKSDRYKDIVEVLPMKQWFVDVNHKIPGKNKSLKDLMKEAATTGHNGDKNKIIEIQPKNFAKTYLHWIDNLRDWCISRQIWWGHRIPVWYRGDNQIYVGAQKPEGEDWQQDEDTLDTWFSSGTWTFSTLGWPAKTQDLKTYHPSSWMQMGYEILFFWMARMILMSTYALDDIPFTKVYLHGMLRDAQGKKFSKSLDNGIDPLEIVKKYGADALRISLIKGLSAGNDSRFYEEKVESAKNFVNKFWNISRFILLNAKNPKLINDEPEPKTLTDQWILHKLNQLIEKTDKNLENSEFAIALQDLQEFTWNDFADWYLEIAKIEGNKEDLMLYILQVLLKLWHPFCPFVTEKIWQNFDQFLLLVATFPKALKNKYELKDFNLIQEIITKIRNLRADYNINNQTLLETQIKTEIYHDLIKNYEKVIIKLAKLKKLTFIDKKGKEGKTALITLSDIEIYIPLGNILDFQNEIAKAQKELTLLQNLVRNLVKQLTNPNFKEKAPKNIILETEEKQLNYQEKIKKLEIQLKNLQQLS